MNKIYRKQKIFLPLILKGISRIIKKIYLIIVKKLYIVVIGFGLVIVIKIYQKKTNNKKVPILKKYHGITKIIFF